MAATVADRLAAVRERMALACLRCGRSPDEVTLVAVSKRVPEELVIDACAAGQWELGENRVADALARSESLPELLRLRSLDPSLLRWHFIGHLQRNKAGKAAGRFSLVHGVDSLALAERLSLPAQQRRAREAVLLEVNISGEPQKNGVDPEAAVELAVAVAALPGIDLRGMMGMARRDDEEAGLRRSFARLRRLCEDARTASGFPLPVLSMGMSADFEAAIAEGSTLVRVGTAIFGPRQEG
ncbi:YggS family pyridoxal phosphate-dependent enzyme [bacterium CG17_big_fil_post_rev_8_21_14_2_50_64_8]|nr:MAG: YggS family pyridoxal phosphate-dependent enzyme [bacterium CG17_big_fil_post_rev_8_21_14_2_50_64_8]PJA77197.1 MAG: YggS family pyridoxal phosphate-dependent enzyme [bacterium CG_4_9_14_3_um_filter_65_15]